MGACLPSLPPPTPPSHTTIGMPHIRGSLLRLQYWDGPRPKPGLLLRLPHPHCLPRHRLPHRRCRLPRRHLRSHYPRHSYGLVPQRHPHRPRLRPLHRRHNSNLPIVEGHLLAPGKFFPHLIVPTSPAFSPSPTSTPLPLYLRTKPNH